MENKNFEKKPTDTGELYNYGYNTCLERTNAKGIYDAAKECDEISVVFGGMKEPAHVRIPLDKWKQLQSELKKAE